MSPITVTPTSPSKAGVTTTEFWATFASLVGSAFAYFGNPKLGGSFHDLIVAQGPVLVGLYVAGRTWLKSVLAKTAAPPP